MSKKRAAALLQHWQALEAECGGLVATMPSQVYFDSDDDFEESESDDDDGNDDGPPKLTESPLESLLGKREASDGTIEWFCKWKGKSYIHCRWVREEEMEPYAHLGRLKGRMTRLTNKILNETDPTIDYTDEKTLYDQSYNVVQEILAEDMEYIVEESEPENEAKGTPSDATPDVDKGENSKEASEHPSSNSFH